MKTNYVGIDYGLGKTNKDSKTGIRYGVIHQNDVGEAWFDVAEANYGKASCPDCGGNVVDSIDCDSENADKDYYCETCHESFWSEECFPDSPISWYYDKNGYSAECGEDGDIFITKSPYFSYGQFCSPCAPGGIYLMNELEESEFNDNNKAYCFNHDFFEDGKAPYRVFSVETNEEILPK